MTDKTFGKASDEPIGATVMSGWMTSRSALLKRAAVLGGSVLATGGLATTLVERAGSAPTTAEDARILSFVLRLERLKAAFYRDAVDSGALTGELSQLADVLARQERAHVSFLRERLGGQSDEEQAYDFGEATRDANVFARTAQRLEEAAVAGYIGQGANLSRPLMVPFAEMCSVEGRHAAWIADVLESDPAPRAADAAKMPQEVLAIIEETEFEVS
jgi:Ferritin-like domain